jgi:DNA-binding transcriptional MerR regulator
MAAPAPDGPLLSIGEVSEATGVAQHVLRYWEGRLPQLRPVKRAGGRRYYRPADVALIRNVQRLIDREGFTLDGAARALSRGEPAIAAAAPAVTSPFAAASATDGGISSAQLLRLRDRLSRALRAD